VRYSVSIPAFGKHRYGDDTANGLAEAAFLADSVHDLAKDFFVADVVGLLTVTRPLNDLFAELFDRFRIELPEVFV